MDLTRNPQIERMSICILIKIWAMGVVNKPKYGENVSNE